MDACSQGPVDSDSGCLSPAKEIAERELRD